MDMEKLRENQVAFYVVLYGFETGPALAVMKKNKAIIVRWPALDEKRAAPNLLDGARKNGSYVPEERTVILKDDEYAFLIKRKPFVGSHEKIVAMLKKALEGGELDEFETDCVKEYIENEK